MIRTLKNPLVTIAIGVLVMFLYLSTIATEGMVNFVLLSIVCTMGVGGIFWLFIAFLIGKVAVMIIIGVFLRDKEAAMGEYNFDVEAIVKYVKEARTYGLKDDAIKATLLTKGWTQKQINQSFDPL